MTFEQQAQNIDEAVTGNSDTVSSAVSDAAKEVSEGTHDLMHRIAISDEVAMPDEEDLANAPQVTAKMIAPGAVEIPPMQVTPGVYQQQGNAELESVLSQLDNLRRLRA